MRRPVRGLGRERALACAALALLALAGGCSAPGEARAEAADEYESFEVGSQRTPSAKTLDSMARILAAQGKDTECEFVLEKLLAEHPDFLPAYGEMAELYLRHDRVGDAGAVLEAGLRRAPGDAVLLNNLGMCRLLEQRYEEALGLFTRAAASDAQGVRGRTNMAVALGMLGRDEEALAIYRQSLPEAEARYNLAVLCEARGDAERAAQEFARAEDARLGARK